MRERSTTAYTTRVGAWQLFLFTAGNPEVPVAVVRRSDKMREIVWYGEYEQLPFDASLFTLPAGLKVEELK